MLGNLKTWWKSPALFNDPFDTQVDLNIGCTVDDIAAAMESRVEGLVFSDEPLAPSMDEGVKRAVLAARPQAPEIDRRELANGLRTGLRSRAPSILAQLHDGQAKWLRWLDDMRVFCVSEISNDILMWSHYADCHRGVVLELRPLTGERGALREAVPIRYTTDIPVMATALQWADHVLGVTPIDFAAYFHALAFSKSEHWRYEREWRCRVTDADSRLDVPGMSRVWACPLLPEEVVAVYIGCRAAGTDRGAILDLVKGRFPRVQVYDAVKNRTRFALDFRRVL
jgi:hypothetical protein